MLALGLRQAMDCESGSKPASFFNLSPDLISSGLSSALILHYDPDISISKPIYTYTSPI
jgi:hypothetical protein